jgi:uncharacterized protein
MSSEMRPLPVPDALTRPYWDAARARRLDLPRCTDCGRWHFYPRCVCPYCGSAALTWASVSGRGRVYSATRVLRAPSPAFEAQVPYVIAVIALEEGPHLMSAVIGCDPTDVKIELPVRADFLELGDTVLPVFRPATG